jgi:FkbM family methyltransferase
MRAVCSALLTVLLLVVHTDALYGKKPAKKATEAPQMFGKNNRTALLNTRHGLMVIPTSDAFIYPCLRLYGEWMEAENRDIYSHFVQSGDVAFDVGANVGSVTLPLAAHVGPTGSVVAIEAHQQISQILSTNVVLNGFRNVAVHWAVVGDAAAGGKRQMVPRIGERNKQTNFGSIAIEASATEQEQQPWLSVDPVPIVAIDDLVIGRCDFVKLDVEGHEPEALDGMHKTLDKFHPAIFMECNDLTCRRTVRKLYDELGYQCQPHMATAFEATNYNGAPRQTPENWVSHNLICVHPDGRTPMPEGVFPEESEIEVAGGGCLVLPAGKFQGCSGKASGGAWSADTNE